MDKKEVMRQFRNVECEECNKKMLRVAEVYEEMGKGVFACDVECTNPNCGHARQYRAEEFPF
jgi:hypothetical protein